MLLDSFELTAADIRSVALDDLHALSVSVCWSHRAGDWDFFLKHGQGVAALDEIGRIVGSAMWFPYSPDFAMIGMVITSPRLQAHGAGRWLMDQVMKATGKRALALNATKAAYRLYRSLGFVEEGTVTHMQGTASSSRQEPVAAPRGSLRPVTSADLPALLALDGAALGVERPDLLAGLLERSDGTALVRGGRIVAYALCRRFGRGHAVGPVVAESAADAVAVMAPSVREHDGSFLRIDTPRATADFKAFLEQSGLEPFDTVTAMSLGQPRPSWTGSAGPGRPAIYGLSNQSLG